MELVWIDTSLRITGRKGLGKEDGACLDGNPSELPRRRGLGKEDGACLDERPLRTHSEEVWFLGFLGFSWFVIPHPQHFPSLQSWVLGLAVVGAARFFATGSFVCAVLDP